MPSALVRVCRRLVPEPLRARVFDPTVHDLDLRRALRLEAGRSLLARLVANARWIASVLLAVAQCSLLRPMAPAAVGDPPATRGDARGLTWARDFRLALRRIRREPMFATFAIATLAFGIGANVAVFSFVNAYLVAPLNVPNGDRLVRVCGYSTSRSCDIVSYPDYADLRDGTPDLDLAAHIVTDAMVGPDDTGESRNVELVTGNYFRVMQVTPIAGRVLDARDDLTELAHPVVVLSEAYWRGREGARTDVVGQTILLNNAAYEVVGIVPATFRGSQAGTPVDLWAPVMQQQQLRPRGQTLQSRGWGWLRLIGRLAPHASLVQVQASLDRTASDLVQRFPKREDIKYRVTHATTLEEGERSKLVPYASMTLALTGLLLVVTCANLAGMMQTRAIGRRREIAIRQSLGAARGRLLAEWLIECVTIATIGGAAGLVVARLIGVGIQRLPAGVLPRTDQVNSLLDWRVMAFAIAMSLLAALLVGLPAARRATALGVADVLKDETGTTSGGRRGLRLRRLTVLVQVTAAAVLLVGSGLLVTSLRNLRGFDTGFRPDHLAGMWLDLKRAHVPKEAAAGFTTAMLERVRSVPGVLAADVVANVPLTNNRDSLGFRIPGYVPDDGKPTVSIDTNVVGATYFATMALGFVRGRSWGPGEPGIVVNETAAKRFWPGRDPIGQSMEVVGQGSLPVAGVVRDSAYYQLGEPPRPFVYLPAEVAKPIQYSLLARTSIPPEDALANITEAVRAADRRVRPTEVSTFEALRESQLFPQRLLAGATLAFGLVALALTAVGLFGVVSTSVAMRTREIGIRMALGARPDGVLVAVLRESVGLVVIGTGIGLVTAYAAAGLLRQWLFGVSRFDAVTYLSVAVVLTVMTLIAAGVPARRAAGIDPVKALRN